MKRRYVYALTIDGFAEWESVRAMLDKAVDWIQPHQNFFLIYSTSEPQTWYNRLKPILGQTQWLLFELNVANRHGWHGTWVGDWLLEKQSHVSS